MPLSIERATLISEIAPRLASAVDRHGMRRLKKGRIALRVVEIAAGDETAIEALGVAGGVLSPGGGDLSASLLHRPGLPLRPWICR